MTIGKQLNTNHNVYVLGAGFSRDAGLPLISDFLVRLRDSIEWLDKSSRAAESESASKVLDFRRAASAAAYWAPMDLENIEELFSLASAAPGEIDLDIKRAIAATLDFCAASYAPPRTHVWCPDFSQLKRKDWLAVEKVEDARYSLSRYAYMLARMLGMFEDGYVRGTNTFISFNYDTLVEAALEELGVAYQYGFAKQSFNSHPTSKARNSADAIKLLKLHGSINWGRKEQGKGRAFTVYGRHADVVANSAHVEIVPPTWKKILENQLEYVWTEAIRALSTATRIIIVGFSMPPTDMHFKYLVAAGLTDNISLRKILFINPDSEELKRRTLKTFRPEYVADGRIDFRAISAFDYLSSAVEMSAVGRSVPQKSGLLNTL